MKTNKKLNGEKVLNGRKCGMGQDQAHTEHGGGNGATRKEDARGEGDKKRPEPGRYRRRGNVARLPKAVRDKINVMIEDGVPYKEIIERLGEEGKGLGKSSLTRWKNGGYKDWLAEQAFITRTRARQETPAELVKDFDGTDVNHAALQLGTLHIFEALRDLGPGTLNQKLGGDCAAFARLLNALARASRETMLLQKYREACTRARAALEPMKDPKRKLSDDERHAIVHQVDEILGLNEAPVLAPGAEPNPALGIITLYHPTEPAAPPAAPRDGGSEVGNHDSAAEPQPS
jgi:hypothetical protein